MSKQTGRFNRRQFVKTMAGAGALLAVPQVIPGSALGKDGAVAAQRTDRAGRNWDRQPRHL